MRRPAVEEQAHRQHDGTRHDQRWGQADLGCQRLARSLLPLDQHVGQGAKGHDADHHADPGREEGQASLTLVKAVLVAVDKGEGRDHEVQDAVGDGDVEGHDSDDRCQDEQLEGSHDGVPPPLAGGLGRGQGAAEFLVACLLAKTGCFLFENRWGVCLLHEEERARDEQTALSGHISVGRSNQSDRHTTMQTSQ